MASNAVHSALTMKQLTSLEKLERKREMVSLQECGGKSLHVLMHEQKWGGSILHYTYSMEGWTPLVVAHIYQKHTPNPDDRSYLSRVVNR